MELTQREAQAKIAEILAEINMLYGEAEALADEYEIGFKYHGPAGYGDGGYYEDGSWNPSSESC